MRLFLAIDLPPSIKKSLSQQLEKLREEYAFFSWIPEENFHITLHFFGETNKVNTIKRKVEEALFDADSFILYSIGSDLFLNHKIVLYIYFRREKKLEELVSKVRKVIQIKERKKFIPHLTIARSKIPSKQQYKNLKKKLYQLPIEIDFKVNKIYLYQSIIATNKPVYKKVAGFSLLKPNRS